MPLTSSIFIQGKRRDMKERIETYKYRVDKISANRYMGDEYVEINKGQSNVIFLVGKILNRLAPELQINIGDIVEIETDNMGFEKSIRVI